MNPAIQVHPGSEQAFLSGEQDRPMSKVSPLRFKGKASYSGGRAGTSGPRHFSALWGRGFGLLNICTKAMG